MLIVRWNNRRRCLQIRVGLYSNDTGTIVIAIVKGVIVFISGRERSAVGRLSRCRRKVLQVTRASLIVGIRSDVYRDSALVASSSAAAEVIWTGDVTG